jgi:cytochrome b6-f complex iron-sulfur subunit
MAETVKAAPEAAKAAPAVKKDDTMSRRNFISWLGLAWGAFAAAMGIATTATMRFLFPNVLFEPPSTFKAGFPEDYAINQVDERWKEKFATWIVRTNETVYALSTVCTHLGCTPNWLAAEAKFKCPCHGSGFYMTGINFEGPAPRPLERFRILLGDDGQLVVDKSKKFQQEKGEWSDPESFVRV